MNWPFPHTHTPHWLCVIQVQLMNSSLWECQKLKDFLTRQAWEHLQNQNSHSCNYKLPKNKQYACKLHIDCKESGENRSMSVVFSSLGSAEKRRVEVSTGMQRGDIIYYFHCCRAGWSLSVLLPEHRGVFNNCFHLIKVPHTNSQHEHTGLKLVAVNKGVNQKEGSEWRYTVQWFSSVKSFNIPCISCPQEALWPNPTICKWISDTA